MARLIYFCRTCQCNEVFNVGITKVLGLALRRDETYWHEVLVQKHDKSHICHHKVCQHPFHWLPEPSRMNQDRNSCIREFRSYIRMGNTHDEAVQKVHQLCNHVPQRYLPGMPLQLEMSNGSSLPTLCTTIEEVGICHDCNLDFPLGISP